MWILKLSEEKQLLRQNRKSLCARISKCIHRSTSRSTETVDSEGNRKWIQVYTCMVIMINVDSKVVFQEKQLLRQNMRSLCVRIHICMHGSTRGSKDTLKSQWNWGQTDGGKSLDTFIFSTMINTYFRLVAEKSQQCK